jgi:hypothetical protein
MARAKWYCYTCGTYFGGEPNNISPEENADISHDGGLIRAERARNAKP